MAIRADGGCLGRRQDRCLLRLVAGQCETVCPDPDLDVSFAERNADDWLASAVDIEPIDRSAGRDGQQTPVRDGTQGTHRAGSDTGHRSVTIAGSDRADGSSRPPTVGVGRISGLQSIGVSRLSPSDGQPTHPSSVPGRVAVPSKPTRSWLRSRSMWPGDLTSLPVTLE